MANSLAIILLCVLAASMYYIYTLDKKVKTCSEEINSLRKELDEYVIKDYDYVDDESLGESPEDNDSLSTISETSEEENASHEEENTPHEEEDAPLLAGHPGDGEIEEEVTIVDGEKSSRCTAKIKTGKRKGELCDKRTSFGTELCKIHSV